MRILGTMRGIIIETAGDRGNSIISYVLPKWLHLEECGPPVRANPPLPAKRELFVITTCTGSWTGGFACDRYTETCVFLVTSTLPRNHVKHRGVERSLSTPRGGKLCGFRRWSTRSTKVRWPTPYNNDSVPNGHQSCETVSTVDRSKEATGEYFLSERPATWWLSFQRRWEPALLQQNYRINTESIRLNPNLCSNRTARTVLLPHLKTKYDKMAAVDNCVSL